ncbi:tRNA pseudouridine(13) synthase TruD [Bermanella sp. R86510]|uniref:tRNA pseudouridine(13) synthase TruD n=1 Tax=unclassified Bermanella TaxID=2627862 RepID=UPI0037CBD358
MDYQSQAKQWPKAYKPLSMRAQFRTQDEDFDVTEISDRKLKDTGPHLYLFIEKKGANTQWLARQLANHAKIDLKDIGYAGLKDRHAVTRQWFSIPAEKRIPDVSTLFNKDEFRLLSQGFYGVKLKRGNLGGNRFSITLRQVEGNQDEINNRLSLIRDQGVPNYFGEQRFGRNYDNIVQGEALIVSGKRPRNRQKASMYLSAVRSFLFNEMLAQRVREQTWTSPLKGEVFGFKGSLRGFKQENTSAEKQRWRDQIIHPTCALWGKGESLSELELQNLEEDIAETYPTLSQGIAKQGLKQERRITRLLVPDLSWQWQNDQTLTLTFSLGSGYFATSILRELGDVQVASSHEHEE